MCIGLKAERSEQRHDSGVVLAREGRIRLKIRGSRRQKREIPAWKAFDWDATGRLNQQGHISDPRGKAKSVVFTQAGFERARQLLEERFSKRAEPKTAPGV
jgi:hypothetical protein